MVATSTTNSSRPPVGYDTMSDDVAVDLWLKSFKGSIAEAGYADVMMAAGYDCLDNMIFTVQDLMINVQGMKPGHANRIARDAAVMLENIGSVSDVVEIVASPTPVTSTYVGADSLKIAGPIPAAPTGFITRGVFAGWVGRLIPWLRLWSKELASALIERRDNHARSQADLAAKYDWEESDNTYLGSQLLVTLGDELKVYLHQDLEDASEGIDMMCVLMDKYMKVDDEYLVGLEDDFRNQKPVNNVSDLSIRLAEWRSARKVLEVKGVPQRELTQKGSLLKVVANIPEMQTVMDSVELVNGGKQLTVDELLVVADRIAGRAPIRSNSNNNNTNSNNNNNTNKPNRGRNQRPLPPTLPLPTIPSPAYQPILPVAMVGARVGRAKACLAWGLSGLSDCSHGTECLYIHDPAKQNTDDPALIALAKSIKCSRGESCRDKAACLFRHD